MSEYEDALWLANKILSRKYADPDDNLAILSRQFLRAVDRADHFQKDLDPYGDVVTANRDEILCKHEEAIAKIGALVRKYKEEGSGMRAIGAVDSRTILKILDALSLFHPMHAESWCGWPES